MTDQLFPLLEFSILDMSDMLIFNCGLRGFMHERQKIKCFLIVTSRDKA